MVCSPKRVPPGGPQRSPAKSVEFPGKSLPSPGSRVFPISTRALLSCTPPTRPLRLSPEYSFNKRGDLEGPRVDRLQTNELDGPSG